MEVYKDFLSTTACGQYLLGQSVITMQTESTRLTACNSISDITDKANCKASKGLTLSADIPANGRYMVTFTCPDAVNLCWLKLSSSNNDNTKIY